MNKSTIFYFCKIKKLKSVKYICEKLIDIEQSETMILSYTINDYNFA